MNVAVTLPASPSITVASLTDSAGSASSSVIVPSACGSAIVAFVAFVRSRTYVSLASSSASPLTVTFTVRVVWPAAKLNVPAAAR